MRPRRRRLARLRRAGRPAPSAEERKLTCRLRRHQQFVREFINLAAAQGFTIERITKAAPASPVVGVARESAPAHSWVVIDLEPS